MQERICEELAELIGTHVPGKITRGLEVGTGTGFLTRRLLERYPDAEWTLNDLVEASECFLQPYVGGRKTQCYWGDAESLPAFGRPFDLIATASTVQWSRQPARFPQPYPRDARCRGQIGVSTFGPDNFEEIRATTGDGLVYYTSAELAGLLKQAGLTIEEQKEYTRRLEFGSPTDVLRHIKATGVNAIRKTRWTPRRLTDFETLYRSRFSTSSGTVTLTYHPILIVARK
ncbi:MAG: malonyl-[acyl-carrier protein] O-methyltransferase BioC [Alistipes indistinctus]